tara:strand:- start:294 stop:1601 length:1308 start_codon:yes stop_codon:yes gene_type:complete
MQGKMTLELKRFSGTIMRGPEVLSIDFDVSADEEGWLSIEPMPLDFHRVTKLREAIGEPGSYSESLTLKGTSDDGSTFFSDTTEMYSARLGTHENSVSLKAREAKVAITTDEPANVPFMRLWFRGFKSYRNPVVATSLGKVEVCGPSKAASRDEMAGYVAVHADSNDITEDWFERADRLLSFMHLGFGFAHGGRLQTPRLDVVVGRRWEATYYDGDGFSKSVAPIHHLNQGPYIKALVKRFEDPRPFADMLWTAIGWLHNDSSFDEGRFLMSMTALETVVEHVIPKTLTTVVEKAAFAPIRTSLLETLANCGLDELTRKIFEGKVKGLNGRTLSQKIQALRDYYDLPDDVFSDGAIIDIIRARNDIVHTGESEKSRDLWPKEVFVREFIALILFRELDYAGPYESYINGYRTVQSQTIVGARTNPDGDDPAPSDQ